MTVSYMTHAQISKIFKLKKKTQFKNKEKQVTYTHTSQQQQTHHLFDVPLTGNYRSIVDVCCLVRDCRVACSL